MERVDTKFNIFNSTFKKGAAHLDSADIDDKTEIDTVRSHVLSPLSETVISPSISRRGSDDLSLEESPVPPMKLGTLKRRLR